MGEKWTIIDENVGGGTIYRGEPSPLWWDCDKCGFSMDAAHCWEDRERSNCPQCELDQLRTRLTEVEAKCEERKRVLFDYNYPCWSDENRDAFCAVCNNMRSYGHAPDCAWAKALED